MFFLRQILRDIAFGVASLAIGGTIGVGVSETIDNITIATTIGGGLVGILADSVVSYGASWFKAKPLEDDNSFQK